MILFFSGFSIHSYSYRTRLCSLFIIVLESLSAELEKINVRRAVYLRISTAYLLVDLLIAISFLFIQRCNFHLAKF